MSSGCCGVSQEENEKNIGKKGDGNNIRESVQDLYGKASQEENPELCCPAGYSDQDLEGLPEEVIKTSFGCGNPTSMSDLKKGDSVLDLGSGAGIDCFIAAKTVGPGGKVIGVDMTSEMLEKANKNKKIVADYLGYDVVEFRAGFLENLPVDDNTVDLLISNCVVNLSPDKDRVFSEMARVIKKGGHFVVSDIVSDRDVPQSMRENDRLWGECISGAVRRDEFLKSMEKAGFYNLKIDKDYIWREEEGIQFSSVTVKGYL